VAASGARERFVAQEFCRCLSKRMGKTHTLTSAADIALP
jgi:hypothetical protein